MLKFERQYYSDEITAIAGVDEAGRGPLAGPVCAAAVIFPYAQRAYHPGHNIRRDARKCENTLVIVGKGGGGYAFAL